MITKVPAFSRKQVLSPESTDLNKLISDSATLLRSGIGESIDLEIVQTAGLWRALVDPGLLETALLNPTG